MRNFVVWILSISLYVELSSAWQMQFSLRDVLKGQCRDVCPRMCKKDSNSLSSDYKCGFACQNVCSTTLRNRRSRRSLKRVCIVFFNYVTSTLKKKSWTGVLLANIAVACRKQMENG